MARSRTSGENLFVVLLMMAPLSQKLEPPANPVRFTAILQANGKLSFAIAWGATCFLTSLPIYSELMARARVSGKAVGYIAATAAANGLAVAIRNASPFEAAG